MLFRSGWSERGNRGSESGDGNCGSHCEAEAGMAERKKQKLSSEMLKRKRTQGTGRRQALVERLWERSEEGRKETNRKPSKRIQESRMRNQTEGTEENRKARAELSTGQAAVRRKREELNGRNRG